jgi:hypothetical protein
VDGELDPKVLPMRTWWRWGLSVEGEHEIRRSAVGIDASGRAFLFGFGERTSPKDIATAMKHAGARDAAELDVNWMWTRFVFFGRRDPAKPPEIVATLVPNVHHRRTWYVQTPEARDFFYVARRGDNRVETARGRGRPPSSQMSK